LTKPAPPEDLRTQDLDREIETELVQHLVRQAPTGFVTGTLTVAAVVFVLWRAAPRSALLVWLAVMALLTAPALAVVLRFHRVPRIPIEIARWRRALALGYGLAGVGWGSASILLYPHVSTAYQLFLLFVLGGSGVGGMVALAPLRGAFVAYLTAIYLPMAGTLLLGASLSSVATGLLLLTFWVAAILLATEFRALLVRSVSLRFENLELIADLSRAKDEAEGASRAKTLFLANVSHELRTPLALILGPTRRLLSTIGDAAGGWRRDLEAVERNAQVLLKHVNDLLDVAKLDARRTVLDRSRVDLVEAVRRTTSLFEIVASERHIELSLWTPDALWIVADPTKLERVLLNLLSNAMKFTPDGGHVRVGLRALRDEAVFSVEDDGPGVPIALREAIFERFRRGDESSAGPGGTGLGLAIAREIVALHGGHIDVGDGAHGGARFEVTLPRRAGTQIGVEVGAASPADRAMLEEIGRQIVEELRPRNEQTPPTLREGGSLGRVLVVEDNPEMREFLADCLSPDHRVATASDARQGLETALELRPDLILCDVMLPGIGGDALVREIRTRPELEGIPILVLTAKADDALRVRLLREGAQDFIVKPVAIEELRARVANFVMMKRARDVLQRALSSQSRDLAAMADELAGANRAKDEFLALLSHELRTPLTPILSWTLFLRKHPFEAATTARALDAIERNARLQVRIVEDLLDVSRAVTGKLSLNVQPIALEPVISAAVESVRPAAEAKSLSLDVSIEPDTGLVSGDSDRLQQVVWNLLSNAIKFTPMHGRIEIRLAHAAEQMRLSVRDNGCGIEPALLPRLFERFWQADSSTTRAQGGLGLGLAVVRHLVDLHGGTIRAESGGTGLGATFTLSLPMLAGPRRNAAEEIETANPPTFPGLRVLVVDDERDSCEIVAAILERAGAEVRTCSSVGQALSTMDRWLPDVLVSDIAMPGEDGYALIRKVRARRTEEGGGVPAVALTAYGRSEDRKRALSAGFQVHLEKPVEPHHLVDTVASARAAGSL
jgi:signal transduction histidine kinase